jgi:Zn-dependent protease
METVIIILVLLVSVILHEVAHGYLAYLNGDNTAKAAGRLTLNPLPHIDPLGTVLMPVILVLMHSPLIFGWAKPVPYNPFNFRNRKWGIFSVGIAGPVTNVLLAALFAIFYKLSPPGELLTTVFYYGTAINVLLAVFNMIPIPPLDGSRVVGVFLPKKAKIVYYSLERWGFVIIVILLYTGILHKVIVPVYKFCLGQLIGV